MFTPSTRNWEEMQYEEAGCWPLPINKGDEFALVTKMSASTIKAACRSCEMSLTVARAETPDGVVLATTLKVADDPSAPRLLSGVLRYEEEQSAIGNILRTGRTLIVFFDELSRPVARAVCTFNSPECDDAFAMVDTAGQRYAGPWTPLLSDVLDEVVGYSDPLRAVPAKYSPAFVTIPLKLSEFETSQTTTVGMGDVLDFRLNDPDEGLGLEQSAWHLLESLFEGDIIHSPQVRENSKPRELIDILAYCDFGLCLLESKAAAVLSTNPNRTTDRRVANVQKQIDKGIGQLVGAMKNINNGAPLEKKDGSPFALPPTVGLIRHGIVLVSEMLHDLDWKAIAEQLIAVSPDPGTMMQVLDLQELRVLVGISRNNPELLMAYLSNRFDVMVERKHAMLRTRLDGPPPP